MEHSSATIWLSGKLVTPVVWLTVAVSVPTWVYLAVGRIGLRSDFRFIVWFAVLETIPLTWVTGHLKLVGYLRRELVVANY